MTDQAEMQSGADVAAPVQATLEAAFKAALRGGPSGQSSENVGENPEGESGVSPELSDAIEEGAPTVERFRLPALEGDGYEELTADEIKAQRLMQKDYTQKTQAVSEERKKIETLKAQTEAAARERLDRLESDLQTAARLIQSYDQNVDWNSLRQLDPAEFLAQREAQAQRIQAWEQARKHSDALKADQRKARRSEEAQRLVENVPEWLDPVRAKADAQKIIEGASQYNLTPADVDNFDDHRMILVLKDALAYRELKAKAGTVKAQVQSAPQLTKPGTPSQGNPQSLAAHRAIQTARKEGTTDTLKDAMRAFLGGKK